MAVREPDPFVGAVERMGVLLERPCVSRQVVGAFDDILLQRPIAHPDTSRAEGGRSERRGEKRQAAEQRNQAPLVPGWPDLERELDRRTPRAVAKLGAGLQAVGSGIQVGVVAERLALRLGPGVFESVEAELVSHLTLAAQGQRAHLDPEVGVFVRQHDRLGAERRRVG